MTVSRSKFPAINLTRITRIAHYFTFKIILSCYYVTARSPLEQEVLQAINTKSAINFPLVCYLHDSHSTHYFLLKLSLLHYVIRTCIHDKSNHLSILKNYLLS